MSDRLGNAVFRNNEILSSQVPHTASSVLLQHERIDIHKIDIGFYYLSLDLRLSACRSNGSFPRLRGDQRRQMNKQ